VRQIVKTLLNRSRLGCLYKAIVVKSLFTFFLSQRTTMRHVRHHELSTTGQKESWTAKERLEAVHIAVVGKSWLLPGRAKALAKNRVGWRVLVDVLPSPG